MIKNNLRRHNFTKLRWKVGDRIPADYLNGNHIGYYYRRSGVYGEDWSRWTYKPNSINGWVGDRMVTQVYYCPEIGHTVMAVTGTHVRIINI